MKQGRGQYKGQETRGPGSRIVANLGRDTFQPKSVLNFPCDTHDKRSTTSPHPCFTTFFGAPNGHFRVSCDNGLPGKIGTSLRLERLMQEHSTNGRPFLGATPNSVVPWAIPAERTPPCQPASSFPQTTTSTGQLSSSF